MALGNINERYRLDAVIGSGAMGTVYHATHLESKEVFAVKHLKPELSTMEFVERFKRESDALQKLNHPNIVHLQEWVEAGGNYYIVMEYLEGGSLAEQLQAEPLPLLQVLNISLDMADALTRTHRLNIIHRDIKPSNILLDSDGNPRLTDFGIAHFNNMQTITNDGQLGTALYMSPEIVSEKPVTHHADIWSFGVLLFEMVTGVRPFDRDTFLQTLLSILNDELPDIEELNPNCPVELVDLIYRMLEKDFNQRIQSVRLVGAELERIMARYNKDNSVFKTLSDSQMSRLNLFETPTDTAIERKKETPTNLPTHVTDFVGRQKEIAELSTLLETRANRLVTIVAPGGMGKTRLSVEVSRRLLQSFPDGVYFVNLYTVTVADDLSATIAEDLNFQFHNADESLDHQLLDFLEHKNMLLVLDNYEHLTDDTYLIGAILETTDNVSLLVTSRHPLSASRETIYNLQGMRTTITNGQVDFDDIEAVQLFLQTARSIMMSYDASTEELQQIAHIVEAVQGMPLAIMLAASWVKLLKPDEILREIQTGIDILEDTSTNDYMTNIRNVLDYSWNLLTPDEQTVFAKLSVFADGFTRSAAQAVAEANLRVMMNLMNYSMLWRNNTSGRYRIHSLLRQYASEKLTDHQQESNVRYRHATYFLEYLASMEEKLRGLEQVKTLDEIEVDFENIRLAWQWAIDNQDHTLINNAVEAMNFFCDMRSYALVGLQLFDEAQKAFSDSEDATIHYVGSRCLGRWVRMNITAMQKITDNMRLHMIKCSAVAQQQGDMQELGFCYWLRGIINDSLDGTLEETIAMFQTSLDLFEETDDRFYQADVMGWLGIWKGYLDPEVGREYTQRCLDIQQQIGNPNGIAWGLLNLAYGYWNHQNYGASTDYARQCLESMRTIRHNKGILDVQRLIGHQHILRGAFEQAQTVLNEAYESSVSLVAGTHQIELGLQLAMLTCLKDNDYVGGRSRLNQTLEKSKHTHAFSWFYAEAVEALIAIGLKEYRKIGNLIETLTAPPVIHTHLIFATIADIFVKYDAKQFGRCAELIGAVYQQDTLVIGWIKQWDATRYLLDDLKSRLGDHFDQHWEVGTTLELNDVWAQHG